jgi:hypothetical protein
VAASEGPVRSVAGATAGSGPAGSGADVGAVWGFESDAATAEVWAIAGAGPVGAGVIALSGMGTGRRMGIGAAMAMAGAAAGVVLGTSGFEEAIAAGVEGGEAGADAVPAGSVDDGTSSARIAGVAIRQHVARTSAVQRGGMA